MMTKKGKSDTPEKKVGDYRYIFFFTECLLKCSFSSCLTSATSEPGEGNSCLRFVIPLPVCTMHSQVKGTHLSPGRS